MDIIMQQSTDVSNGQQENIYQREEEEEKQDDEMNQQVDLRHVIPENRQEEESQRSQISEISSNNNQNNQEINNQIQQFQDDMSLDFQNLIQQSDSKQMVDENGISSTEFEMKCQLKNELKKVSTARKDAYNYNQNLTSEEFFNKDKSFLFRKMDGNDNQESIKRSSTNNLQSIVHQTPYQNVNVGLSNIRFKNQINPQLFNSTINNINKNQEDYLMQLFDDNTSSRQYSEQQQLEIQGIQQKKTLLSDNDIRRHLICSNLCYTNQPTTQQYEQVLKQLDIDAFLVLQQLKSSNNSQLLSLLSKIDPSSNMQAIQNVRARYILKIKETQ